METKMDLPPVENTHAIFCIILGIEGHNETMNIQLGKITLVQGGCLKCLEDSFTALLVQEPKVRELINKAGRRANEIRKADKERGGENLN